jgi:hypothetical protein
VFCVHVFDCRSEKCYGFNFLIFINSLPSMDVVIFVHNTSGLFPDCAQFTVHNHTTICTLSSGGTWSRCRPVTGCSNRFLVFYFISPEYTWIQYLAHVTAAIFKVVTTNKLLSSRLIRRYISFSVDTAPLNDLRINTHIIVEHFNHLYSLYP